MKDHGPHIVKFLLKFIQILCISNGEKVPYGRIYLGQRPKITPDLFFGVLVVRLIPEGIELVTASVYSFSQQVQLYEHCMVWDGPPYGFISNYLCPEESPLKVAHHIQLRWLGEFLDEEIY